MTRFLPLIVFLALAVVFAVPLLTGKDMHRMESPLIGKPVPGRLITPADLAGQPVLVNFFASWCVSCAAEQEVLADIATHDKVAIIGIAYKDKPDALKKWLAAHGNPFKKIVNDPTGAAAIDWGVSGVPETFLVDAGGYIRFRYPGPLTRDVFDAEFASLLAEMKE